MQMLVSIGTLRITDANIDKCWYVKDNYVPQTKFGRYIVCSVSSSSSSSSSSRLSFFLPPKVCPTHFS
jgi:hypothetical protein